MASFSNDDCSPWLMQQALGIERLRFASMVWGGGGAGACGALAHAQAAVESGQADTVLVSRSIVQRPGQRYGEAGGFAEIPQIDLMAPTACWPRPSCSRRWRSATCTISASGRSSSPRSR